MVLLICPQGDWLITILFFNQYCAGSLPAAELGASPALSQRFYRFSSCFIQMKASAFLILFVVLSIRFVPSLFTLSISSILVKASLISSLESLTLLFTSSLLDHRMSMLLAKNFEWSFRCPLSP